MRNPATLLALIGLTSSLHAGDVITVRLDGTGDFTDVASAVAAANDGDILLFGPGNFLGYFPPLDDRELSFVADASEKTSISDVLVENLSADKQVLFSGLQIWGGVYDEHPGAAWVRDSAGAVRFDSCEIHGPSWGLYCEGYTALRVERSSDLAVLRSDAEGGDAGNDDGGCWTTFFRGGAGLIARRSTVATWRSKFTGGDGAAGIWIDYPSGGGHGARVRNSTMFAFQTLFSGGKGGDDNGAGCREGGDGLRGPVDADIWEQGSVFVEGEGGSGGCMDGEALNVPAGNHHPIAGVPRSILGPRLVTSGQPMSLDVFGLAGDRAVLVLTDRTGLTHDPAKRGVWITEPGHLALRTEVGTIDGSGKLQVTLPAPTLAAGEEGEVFYLQVAVRDAGGTEHVGSPIAIVVLE